jgi:hypothetical protein
MGYPVPGRIRLQEPDPRGLGNLKFETAKRGNAFNGTQSWKDYAGEAQQQL